MAEGGNNDDNPFSFQQFVKLNKQGNKQEEQHTNSLSLDDTHPTTPKKRQVNKLIVIEDGEENAVKTEENSISFKHFLRRDPVEVKQSSSSKSRIKIDDQPTIKLPDFASDLPDFVQDNYHKDQTIREKAKESFQECDRLENSSFYSAVSATTRSNENSPSPVPSESKRTGTRNKGDTTIIPNRLPDFLSDGPMPTSRNDESSFEEENRKKIHTSRTNGRTTNELQWRHEELKAKLHEANHLSSTQARKIQTLQDEVRILRAKETEETNALEQVVHNVESNLKSAMQRAIASETLATSLRQEVKALQMKVSVLKAENEALRSGNPRVTDIKNKAQNASMELQLAAKTAEQNLRQLLAGVSTLNLIASSLHDIDKLTEDDNLDMNQ